MAAHRNGISLPAAAALSLLLVAALLPLHANAASKLPRARGQIFRKCAWSHIKGYTSTLLLEKDLRVHWKVVDDSTVKFALIAAKGSPAAKGWFSLGFSDTNGEMEGDGIVAESSDSKKPLILALTGLTAADVAVADWTPADASIEKTRNGGSVLKFTRKAGDGGLVTVKTSGLQWLMWVYKEAEFNMMDEHDLYGFAQMDLSCNPCKGLRRIFCRG